MTVSLLLDTYVFVLCRTGNLWLNQGQRQVSSQSPSVHFRIQSAQPATKLQFKRPLSCKAWYSNLKQSHCTNYRGLKVWVSRVSYLRKKLGLHTNISFLSTSVSRGTTSFNHRMSRIKSTLDSVSKAVSGTHSELLSRIARFKPNAVQACKEVESNVRANNEGSRRESSGTEIDKLTLLEEKKQPLEQSFQNSGKSTSSLTKAVQNTSGNNSKQSVIELFHPSYLTTNFGETYNFLASHINEYFGEGTRMDKKESDSNGNSKCSGKGSPLHSSADQSSALGAPAADSQSSESLPSSSDPASPKKRIAHYLSNPGHSVQAFVGSYLVPLVPKFRYESKGIPEEKEKTPTVVEAGVIKGEVANGKDQKNVDDKAKRLLLQREKIIARVSVDNRTRALVQALQRASDIKIYIHRVEELSYHLLEFPETRGVAVKEKVIPCLLRLRQASDETLQAAVREALALVGYTDPVKGRGIRVLSIDGGGTRGLVALQTLHKLEDLTGKPVYQLFDYICGVSTGAILAFMLGVFQIPLDECEELYRRLGSDVFKQNVILGTVKMGWSHAFYDSEMWEAILKEKMGSDLMIETSRNSKCPKVAAVSTIVNRGTPLKAYVFRNYNLLPGVKSHYLGGCQHKLWQAIRASSAAPGYFQEFVLGNDLHQDGGLLINNPTALAIHECKCLWPNTPVQCVISLGTGRFESAGKNNATYTSLKTKLTNVISSATDTEEVHTMLDALLPQDTYFRFNPFMNEDIPLDESRKEKLNQLQIDGVHYLERNEQKLKKAANILIQEKTTLQRLHDWVKLKADMYDGLPFFAKL
ncbi:calcium-independent phospholipase A2-gamma isoform X1 [Lepisosteus oculatus]|uniref:calcium-independent phospholipase A2-gamma isoform X1 n=1 Tax=Lepisosteus oculatus TaxID=7918 RepID=UPI003721E9A5